jgi:potassium-transporting ATPase KdpC subunit
MKKNLVTAVLYTLVTTLLLGIIYPLVVTALAHLIVPDKANGQMITRNGQVIGSRIIAQPFTGGGYFHPRPSAAGANGYDATASSGSNLGPTNQKLIDRVNGDVATAQKQNPNVLVPVDMVTTSGSGLDPDITIANAEFQASRVARARQLPLGKVSQLIAQHTAPRQFGIFGEPRVNVLELNLALDGTRP